MLARNWRGAGRDRHRRRARGTLRRRGQGAHGSGRSRWAQRSEITSSAAAPRPRASSRATGARSTRRFLVAWVEGGVEWIRQRLRRMNHPLGRRDATDGNLADVSPRARRLSLVAPPLRGHRRTRTLWQALRVGAAAAVSTRTRSRASTKHSLRRRAPTSRRHGRAPRSVIPAVGSSKPRCRQDRIHPSRDRARRRGALREQQRTPFSSRIPAPRRRSPPLRRRRATVAGASSSSSPRVGSFPPRRLGGHRSDRGVDRARAHEGARGDRARNAHTIARPIPREVVSCSVPRRRARFRADGPGASRDRGRTGAMGASKKEAYAALLDRAAQASRSSASVADPDRDPMIVMA